MPFLDLLETSIHEMIRNVCYTVHLLLKLKYVTIFTGNVFRAKTRCTKCHAKTTHEVREKTLIGIRLVCSDCGQYELIHVIRNLYNNPTAKK